MAADPQKIREELGKSVDAIMGAVEATLQEGPTPTSSGVQHQLYLDNLLGQQMASLNCNVDGSFKGFVAHFEYKGHTYRLELHAETKVVF